MLRSLSGRPLLRCRACGHSFLHVGAPETIEAAYNDHAYAGFREDPIFRREVHRIIVEDIAPRVPAPARILDVGCGNGEFLALARDAGYRGVGVDVSEAAGEICRGRGLDARIGDFRGDGVIGPGETFDLVTFWDVVEHLPDPRSFLVRAHQLLSPGGHVLIKTPLLSPASVRLAATVPRLAGALLQVPSHIQFFRRAGLAALLDGAGFAKARWLPSRGMRAPGGGGTLRRRVARIVVREIHRLARDGNLLVLAEKPV